MALIYNKPENHDGTLKPTYKGRVVGTDTRHSVRIMSDVWADIGYAVVWDDETSEPVNVAISNSEFGTEATAKIDATKATIKKYEAWKAAKAVEAEDARVRQEALDSKRRADEREESAKRNALAVRKGVKVTVVKGRKVPKGTTGFCFWEGHGQYGARIGLKEEDGTVHWTATSNCVAVLDDVATGATPDGGWTAYMEAKHVELEAAAALLPKKGEWVKATKGDDAGKCGKVFWTKGTRLGFKMNPRDKSEEPVWANAENVEVLTGDPRKGGTVDATRKDTPAPEAKTNPMAGMPYPYCAISKLEIVDGVWKAYDVDGGFLLDLTAAAAVKLMEKLAA